MRCQSVFTSHSLRRHLQSGKASDRDLITGGAAIGGITATVLKKEVPRHAEGSSLAYNSSSWPLLVGQFLLREGLRALVPPRASSLTEPA